MNDEQLDAYEAERRLAQSEVISQSMDRALGYPLAPKETRVIQPRPLARTDSAYNPFRW